MENSFSTQKLIVLGLTVMLVTIGGFLAWSMTMSLSSASVAQGSLVVESKRKQIQHLQGGWVKEVFVKDGQQVEVGQLLVELSDSKSESDFKRYLYRNYALLAHQARLQALIDEEKSINWPSALINAEENFVIQPILNNENVQFDQAMLKLELIESLYLQKSSLYQEKMQGNRFQRRAITTQRDLVRQEINMTKGLVNKGFVSKTRLLELQRHEARIRAELAEISVNIDVAKRGLAALKESYRTQKVELSQEYLREMKAVNGELTDIAQVMENIEDVRSRIQIRSEFSGRVVGLNISSVGGVVKPGQVLMEIVPESDDLIVEAIVSPKDIDIVREGQTARVRLTAYSARQVPPVLGEVINVSADRVIQGGDAEGADQGYIVTIRFDKSDLTSLKTEQKVELYPGMLTEVLILVEERTLWDYLIGPLSSGLSRAMREA